MFAEDEVQNKYPSYVMAPQSDESVEGGSWSNDELDNVAGAAEELIKDGKVDKTRVYVIGHSMGGQGAWNILRRHPKLFAAAITTSPRVISEEAELEDLSNLSDLPVWMFHASSDPINLVSGSRDRYNKLVELGNTKVKYTELSDDDMKAYGLGELSPYQYHFTNVVMANTPGIEDWLYAQRKVINKVDKDYSLAKILILGAVVVSGVICGIEKDRRDKKNK